MLQDITKVVSLILGISVASDRLITLIKSIIPKLAAPAGSPAPGPPSGDETKNRVILIAISFICCLITAELMGLSGIKSPYGDGAWNQGLLFFIAFLATGGSAFWTNLLGYFSALKDVTNIKALKSMADFNASRNGDEHGVDRTHDKRPHIAAMKTVTFAAAFSGGDGTLSIEIAQTGDSIEFDTDGSKDLQLPEGEIDFTVSGAASPGPGGGVVLTISGARVSNSPIKFGAGRIPVKEQTMIV